MTDRSPLLDVRQTALWLLAGLALVVMVRVWVPYDEVFRDGAVVLAGNDPYFYRYAIEQLYGSGLSSINPFDLAELPAGLREHDVLFIWAMWPWALLLGGGSRGSGLVLAWYPVVSALVTGVLVFVIALWVTGDRRVAVLSVFVLALTPAHAYRTMLGFGDHHGFDYVALMVTAAALVWLGPWEFGWDDSVRKHVEWLVGVGLLGGAVAAQVLAWRGGPILLIPIGVYAIVGTVSSVDAGRSPTSSHLGLLVGLALASMLGAFVHIGLNWAPAYRGFAPFVLFGFVAWVLAVGELAYVRGSSWLDATIGMPIAVGLWLVTLLVVGPELLLPLDKFLQFLQDASLGQSAGIGETFSLFGSLDQPLLLFGLVLVVAVPAMAWVANELRQEYHPGWLAVSAYAWVFLAMSINRVRFTGQLALFTSVFAAVALVWVAGRMEEASPLAIFGRRSGWRPFGWTPAEESEPLRVIATLGLLVLLVTGVGVAQLPATMDQITVDDPTFEAASWMAEYSATQGWAYPENYVFSEWGKNRAYNYFVSGESESYGYAKRNYRAFVSSSASAAWYDALDGGTGFIVVRSTAFTYPSDSMQVRLFERHGSAGEGVRGLEHYRLVYVGDTGELKVFTLVPGATIVGMAAPDAALSVATEVRVHGTTFTYRRTVRTDGDGHFSVTVPYAGAYEIGSRTVTVTEADVTAGETLRIGSGG